MAPITVSSIPIPSHFRFFNYLRARVRTHMFYLLPQEGNRAHDPDKGSPAPGAPAVPNGTARTITPAGWFQTPFSTWGLCVTALFSSKVSQQIGLK